MSARDQILQRIAAAHVPAGPALPPPAPVEPVADRLAVFARELEKLGGELVLADDTAAAAARLFGGRTGHGTRGRRHRRRPRLAARPRFGTASGRLPARFSPAGIRSARALTLAARSAAGLPPGGALFGCLGFGAAAFRTAPPSVARRFPLGIFRAPAGLVLMFFGGLRLLAEQFACYFFNESEWHRDKPVVENKMRTPARDARTFKRM